MDDWEYKPSTDLDLPPFEALKSLKREPGLPSLLLQRFWNCSCLVYMKLYHRLEVYGAENLPTQPPFVLVANHTSHLDTLALVAAVPRKLRSHIYPIAAGDHFFKTTPHSFFAAMFLNALPMWRKNSVGHALQQLREKLLESETIFILYPEGTRSRNGEMNSFKAGIGRLVSETAIPVVPVRIRGAFEALPAAKKLPRPRKIVVSVGRPQQFDHCANDRAGWQKVSLALQNSVAALAC